MSKVFQVGNKIIREKTKKVDFPLSTKDKNIIKKLIKIMREEGLVGIAAPQIGISKNIFVVEPRETKTRKIKKEELIIFINPKITKFSKKKISGWEGCGSVAHADLFAKVKRSEKVEVNYFDEKGNNMIEVFSGFFSVVIQHEFDHNNGIVFLDKVDDAGTFMSGNEYKKFINRKRNIK